MKANAEHQQHHTDFRELRGERSVRNDAGRVLARRNAREQITHESRRSEDTFGYKTEDKRK